MTSNTYGDGETAAEEAPWLLQGKIKDIAGLCKGSTTDSDSVCEGSNPSPAAKSEQAIQSLLRLFYKSQSARRCSSFPNRTRCAGLRFGF